MSTPLDRVRGSFSGIFDRLDRCSALIEMVAFGSLVLLVMLAMSAVTRAAPWKTDRTVCFERGGVIVERVRAPGGFEPGGCIAPPERISTDARGTE